MKRYVPEFTKYKFNEQDDEIDEIDVMEMSMDLSDVLESKLKKKAAEIKKEVKMGMVDFFKQQKVSKKDKDEIIQVLKDHAEDSDIDDLSLVYWSLLNQ